MKIYSIILYFLIYISSFSQNTEVYLFDLKKNNNSIEITNKKNISSNPGYDNQPSFYNDTILTFVSTRNNQTDIATLNLNDNNFEFLNNTPDGGEYSPLKIPDSKDISAVRLDNDGKQRLYRYNYNTGKSKELIKDLIVAYYIWYDENTIVSSVIENDTLNLYVSNIKTGKNIKYTSNTGRSFHKIPNSNLVSFISKEEDGWYIKSLHPKTGEIKTIIQTIPNVEDMCWLPDGTILIPTKGTIVKFNPKTDKNFSILKNFDDDNLNNITRIISNKTGSKLALVSEVSPVFIVQKQLDAYNARDLDAFMATYSKDVKLYNYPNNLRTEGHEAMKNSYKSYFENTSDLNCKILKRIVTGNKVIYHELITANGNTFKAVAIYEVVNGLISKVTFL